VIVLRQRLPEQEVALRPPYPVPAMLEEAETPDREPHVIAGQGVEGALENGRREIVGDRDMRVVRKQQLPRQRARAHAFLDALAVADAHRHGDEDHG